MPEIENNKYHWYDGWFYDFVIAPNQDRAFGIVKTIIPEQSTVLDAGCGTGRLAFTLTETCSRIDGIDLSQRNICRAQRNLRRHPASNISFYHTDVQSFLTARNEMYDFAVLSYVIHEVEKGERRNILTALSTSAKNIIIVDYLFPRPPGIWSAVNKAVEFVAGREHYRNFKSYLEDGGVHGLAKQSGLKIAHEIKNNPLTSHIAVLTKIKDLL